MKTIIGQAARGNDFFPRKQITEEIWTKLEAGSNLLLVAPRRVGKSSILFDLLDNPKEGYLVIYYTSESVNDINEFYRKLFNHIIDELDLVQKNLTKAKGLTNKFLSRIKAISLKDLGLTFGDSQISYIDELNKLLDNINLKQDRFVILIDEFAETVQNILRDHNKQKAINFIQTNREIRQSPNIYKRIQFVYAGSIGLENVVSSMDSMNSINDLVPIKIRPLNLKEAKNLTDKIINNNDITFEQDAFNYLVNKIEWLIPFFFQIILDEIDKILYNNKSKVINRATIDDAILTALKHRNYFENWFTRLRMAYKGEEFAFVKEVLNSISNNLSIKSIEITDLAIKYKIEETYRSMLNALIHDGYINNEGDPKVYRFNSPLLKEWWYCNVAN